jgi:hypothetical protein
VIVAAVLTVVPVGPESIVTTGASVSTGSATVHSWSAGVSSTRPSELVAWTSKLCGPSTRPLTGCGESHAANGSPSSEHSKVEFSWSDEKRNVAVGLELGLAGAESASIVV